MRTVDRGSITLDHKVTGAQKEKIRQYAVSEYGGFAKGRWGETGVSGAVVVALNGRPGPNRHFDSAGSYNSTWDGSFSLTARPGRIHLATKPLHYQIPGNMGDIYDFNASAGHHYFVGYIVEEQGGFRWVPVVYDKTRDNVVRPRGVKTRALAGRPASSVPIFLPSY